MNEKGMIPVPVDTGAMNGNSQQIATWLLQQLKSKAQAEAALSDLNKLVMAGQIKLAERMDDEGVDKVSIEGIEFVPFLDEDYSLAGEQAGRKWDDCEEWFQWLKDQGLGDVIKSKLSVHFATRKKVLSEHISEGKQLPSFIQERFMQSVKWNKSAVERLAVI